MKWKHEQWTIQGFLDQYDADKIELSPSYQRNPIWTAKAQKLLIDTILAPQPLPNFFVRVTAGGKFEMVDGQQRARTILAFRSGDVTSTDKECLDSLKDKERFFKFPLDITVIHQLEKEESIEKYYALVNSSGLRLNIPELRKAEYYDTRFLKLASKLAASPGFLSLNLFSKDTVRRMNDVELVIELLALLLCGISEKKNKVDELFENDMSAEQAVAAEKDFNAVVDVLTALDSFSPLNDTRFRQRADLYTLFEFIHAHNDLQKEIFKYYYRVLLTVADGISPSQKECDPLRDYARNCVTQSNSLPARQGRSDFVRNLLRHNSSSPNEIQEQIIKYFEFSSALTEQGGAWTVTLPKAVE